MADKKISQLNTATTVFDADVFTIVQDGETKKSIASTVKAYAKDGLSKSDVGLGNVDNTSDASKPVSTATQTALNLKQDAASAVTLTGTQTLTNKTLTSPTINGGTANNVAIGGTTPAAGNFTTLGATGDVTLGDAAGDTLTINAGTANFAGTGQRITGDFSNATIANRLAFQTSTANAITSVGAVPSGNVAASNFIAYGLSDPNNSHGIGIIAPSANEVSIRSIATGTGTFLPMTFYTGGREAMRIGVTAGSDLSSLGIGYTSLSGVGEYGLAVSGKVGIGTSSPVAKLDVAGGVRGTGLTVTSIGVEFGANQTTVDFLSGAGSRIIAWGSNTSTRGSLRLITASSDASLYTEAVILDSSGNLLVGGTVTPSGAGNIVCESATGKVGYGTGAGGTVTQATSKTTAVTLNKPCGQIIMNNAALGAGIRVEFILYNSLLSTTDNIVFTQMGGSVTRYIIGTRTIGVGFCTINVTNPEGGSLSEAVEINFAIIRGATS